MDLDYIYLKQEGASSYQAALPKNHSCTLGIWGYFIDWPPCSPACNPIENVWRTIKQYIRQYNLSPTTNKTLQVAI